MRPKPRKSPEKPTLTLPPPPKGWAVFRRSGQIKEIERMTVAAIQEQYPELQAYSSSLLVEAYRSYKRKHPAEIALEGQER